MHCGGAISLDLRFVYFSEAEGGTTEIDFSNQLCYGGSGCSVLMAYITAKSKAKTKTKTKNKKQKTKIKSE